MDHLTRVYDTAHPLARNQKPEGQQSENQMRGEKYR
jgi:hypothetical protein